MNIFKIITTIFTITIIASCSENCELNDINISDLPVAKVDSTYYYKIQLSSNCEIVYRYFEKIDGTLPDGINFETTGEISGIPSNPGIFEFTIKAKACFGSNGFEYIDCHEKTNKFILKVLQ